MAMAEVFYRAVREGAKGAYTEAQLEAWAPQVEPNWDRPDKLLDQWAWVAEEDDGRLLGIMSLEPGGYLDMAFVIPEAMGGDVAPALHAALIARFLKQGWQVDALRMHPAAGEVYETYLMSLDLSALSQG
jgi:putative acetyltransferase